jgi:hypothetical protein
MIAAALLLSLPTLATAAEPSTSTAYWSKTYSIPEAYKRYSIGFETPNPERLRKLSETLLEGMGAVRVEPPRSLRAQGSVSGYWPEPSQGLWKVASSSAAAAVAALRSLPGMYLYEQEGEVEPHPELYDKRDGLRTEIASLGPVLDGLPATRGLLEAELTTLQRLIAIHEHAASGGYILLTVDGDRRTPAVFTRIGGGPLAAASSLYMPSDPRVAVVRLSSGPAAAGLQWTRDAPSSCGPVGLRLIAVSFADRARGAELIQREMKRRGGNQTLPSCRAPGLPARGDFEVGEPVYIEFPSRSNFEKFSRRISELGPLVRWEDADASPFRSAQRRRALLRDELKSGALARAPMIQSLVEAEAERLAPFSDKYDEFLSHPTVEVIPVAPKF